MRRRPYNLIWLLLAVLFAGQSLLPVAALAQVSVRCVGAPASSAPCAQATVVAADTAAINRRVAGFACCRMMANCPTMAVGVHNPIAATAAFSVSAPKCLVSVNLLNTKPAALGLQAQRWLLLSAPAVAPPAARPISVTPKFSSTVAFSTASFDLPPSVSTHSHGLRAPPAA